MYTLCMCVCLLCVNVLGKNTLPTLLCFGVGVMQHPHLHQDTAFDPRHQHSSFSLQSPNCASVTWLFVLSHLLHWLKANKFSLLRFLNICVNSSASSLPGYPWHICFYHIPCSNLTTVTLFRVSCRNIDIPDFWMTSVPSAHTVTQSQFCRCFEIVEGIIIVIAENRHHYSTGMIHEKSYSNMEEISNSLYKNYKFVPFSSQLLTTFLFFWMVFKIILKVKTFESQLISLILSLYQSILTTCSEVIYMFLFWTFLLFFCIWEFLTVRS